MIGMAALGLLKGVSLKTYGFIALGILALILATKFMLWIGGKDDAVAFAQSQVAELTKANARVQAQRVQAEVGRDTALFALSRQAAAQADARVLLEQLNATQQATRAEVNALHDIFDRHDLQKLANKKAGLIERRVNDGTQRVFDNLQNAINSTD